MFKPVQEIEYLHAARRTMRACQRASGSVSGSARTSKSDSDKGNSHGELAKWHEDGIKIIEW